MTGLRTRRTEPGAEVLTLGWIPTGGFRWVDNPEFRPWVDPVDHFEPPSVGPWLVPAGPPVARHELRRPDVLREFLKLGPQSPTQLMAHDPRLGQIAEFASRFGALGAAVVLIPRDGGDGVRGEPFATWLSEIAKLRTYKAVLDACDRAERRNPRLIRARAAASNQQILEAARSAALWLGLTQAQAESSTSEALIREVRLRVRESLQAGLEGRFSAVLAADGGPVERFVPFTLAAALELELARRAVKRDLPWKVCKAPGCDNNFVQSRRGEGDTSQRYCSPTCRKRASRSPQVVGAVQARRTGGKA